MSTDNCFTECRSAKNTSRRQWKIESHIQMYKILSIKIVQIDIFSDKHRVCVQLALLKQMRDLQREEFILAQVFRDFNPRSSSLWLWAVVKQQIMAGSTWRGRLIPTCWEAEEERKRKGQRPTVSLQPLPGFTSF